MLKNPNYVYGPRRLQVPVNLNFGDYILERLVKYGNNIAMINGATGEQQTYKEIAQQAMNFSVSLTRMNVRGETIALMSENRDDFWGAVVGVACAGAVLTTISTAYVRGELTHVLNVSKPSYIICSPAMYKKHNTTFKTLPFLKKIILFGEEKHPDVIMYDDLTFERNKMVKNVNYEDFHSVEVKGQTDTLFILYSSGTTGLPKGVMLTHLNVITACCLPPSHDPEKSTLTISPWYHVMGLVGILTGLAIGRTGVYLSKFDMELYFKTIEKYKVAQLTVVPPVVVAACKYPTKCDLSSVIMLYSGAAPLRKDTIEAVKEKFPNIQGVFQGYGCTELTLAVLRFNYNDKAKNKTGSAGAIVADTVIKVVDLETGKPLGPNCRGEICVKSPLQMKGYVDKDPGEDLDEEGFYKTGDVGYYDDDKYFYIVDRLKELIKYKGFQVPPAELEAVLLQHPGIKDAAVIGVEDKVAGEVPLAFVVKLEGQQVTEDDVKAFIAERLSNPKHLRGGVRFIEQIPKSASGKILRKDLILMAKPVKSHL
ncbi:luciferin 4-monooxygenase-like [Anticarsia gemmatalis]|uniref:luciferin 4-monooxygenase-like n=1 Tax=Anticarsia gemmatalis TaxID=129554 RepID=UPI003F763DFE